LRSVPIDIVGHAFQWLCSAPTDIIGHAFMMTA